MNAQIKTQQSAPAQSAVLGSQKQDALTKDVFERIARMEQMGVKTSEIAQATGLTPGRISQIKADSNYKTMLANIEVSNLERFQSLNKGWDNVEAMSLTNVLQALKENPDPDFALRAASVANKASRHGRHNIPLNGNHGVRAVVHLNAVFAEKLQQNFNIKDRRSHMETLDQKDSSFMPPNEVETLLKPKVLIKQKPDDNLGKLINGAFSDVQLT